MFKTVKVSYFLIKDLPFGLEAILMINEKINFGILIDFSRIL